MTITHKAKTSSSRNEFTEPGYRTSYCSAIVEAVTVTHNWKKVDCPKCIQIYIQERENAKKRKEKRDNDRAAIERLRMRKLAELEQYNRDRLAKLGIELLP